MTNEGASWLPSLILLSDYGGDWESYLDALYSSFASDFCISPLAPFDNKRVGLKRHPMFKNREATFWHFISSGAIEEGRLPDLRRCERIRWPKALMDAVDSGKVFGWKNKRGSEDRYVLAVPDFSYILVLADRGNYVLPWTAYQIDTLYQRQKLDKEYQESLKGWCRP